MFCMNLTVYQLHTLFLKVLNKTDKDELRSIAFFAKHAFAKKDLSQLNAIHSANKLVIFPCFCTMGKTAVVKFCVHRFHFRGNPCPILAFPWNRSTSINHIFKCGVNPELE